VPQSAAVSGKDHRGWDEFRDAMVRERRRAIIVMATSIIGLIRRVWR
jgi:hypothetical protein